jgi:serine/threonine protein kinase
MPGSLPQHGGPFPAAKQSQAPAMPGASPDQLDNLIGHSFVHYRIDSVLSVGSTAIKVLFPDRMANEEERDRFIRAMKTMLPFRHPNIVRIYNAGKSGRHCWAAMEFIDGENLNQVIDRIGIEGMNAIGLLPRLRSYFESQDFVFATDRDLGLLTYLERFDRIGVIVDIFYLATCEFDHNVFGLHPCIRSRPVFGNP